MVKIRLRREGSRNHPYYRVVVSDSRKRPTGPMIEIIGHYNPKSDPPAIVVDMDRYNDWLSRGAQASESVKTLVARQAKAAPAAESTA